MAKVGKKNKSKSAPAKAGRSSEQRNAQGVNGRGNTLRSTTALGLLFVIVPTVLAVIYLYLLRAPGRQDDLVEQVSESYAQQQAKIVGDAVAALRQRVQAAAGSPLALQAIADQSLDELAVVEETMLAYFPDAVSLRLLPLSDMGTADLQKDLQGMRNHIEVDLVRRVSNGEPAQPEAYELDGAWLASLAQITTHPQFPSRRAVVMVTVSADALKTLLSYPGEMPGRFDLEQRVYGNGGDRNLVVATQGSGTADRSYRADVPDTAWRIIFSPSATLIDDVTAKVNPDYDILLLVFLCGLIGFGLAYVRSSRALATEVGKITAAAEHRTPLDVDIPQLVPMAMELRKQTLRRARVGNMGSVVPAVDTGGPASATAMTAVEGQATQGLPAHIFRAYDIRGIADTELDDETVYRIGSAVGTIAGEQGEQTLVLAADGRASSSRIKGIIEKALLQSGRDVIDIGLVPTPLLYFATKNLDASSGIMITGSHNPAEFNGLKIVLQGQTIAQGTIDKVRSLAQSGRFSKGTGHVIQKDVVGDYLDEVISDIAIAVPLKIVVDAGNGATGHIAPALLEELGCEVIPLYCDVDGSFPNHSPDTSNEDNLRDLIREVASHDADFGVAYDGDGDRLAVVSGSGRILRTDTLMMLFARDVVSRNPGADVVYDVKCSRNLAQVVTGLGGRPVLWKTGHALMKQKMLETGALLGGEFSGHIFFGERWYGFDDGMYATGRLAEILSSQELGLDDFIADLPVDVSTPEILVPVAEDEKFAIIERFKTSASFADGKSNDLDGLRVDFKDGWGLLRASNTSAALTARFEAIDDGALEKIRGQFRDQLAEVAPDLTIPF